MVRPSLSILCQRYTGTDAKLSFFSKIPSDYELRDVHDEINKQMRGKLHWENQIVALGGDYSPGRNVATSAAPRSSPVRASSSSPARQPRRRPTPRLKVRVYEVSESRPE
ncbi:hypothetical protein K438DRAFT_95101 [Mycena galopus ATCC 62051]|nr:hypothetical protein K438DRAFT_95101 [Mycena galopus ATCC 62051]